MDISQALDVFLVLTLTYPRYVDTASRSAALAVLSALARSDESHKCRGRSNLSGLVERISKWLYNEATRICAPAVRRLRQLFLALHTPTESA